MQGLTKLKQIVTTLSRASKTDRRGEPAAVTRASRRAGSARSSATAGSGRTLSTRRSAIPPSQQSMGAYPDAEPHQGQVHAGVPRRLRSCRAGDEQEQGAGLRLDQGLHQRRARCASWRRSASRSRTRRRWPRSTRRTRSSRRSRRRRSPACSSRRHRTGSKVENANVLQNMLSSIFTGRTSVKSAAKTREQPDHQDPQRADDVSLGPGSEAGFPARHRRAAAGVSLATGGGVSVGERAFRRCSPYLLLAPAPLVIGAVLGYPVYFLAPALVPAATASPSWSRRRARGSASTTSRAIFHDEQFWAVVLRTVVFTAVNVGLTMVLRDADRAPARTARTVHAPAARRPGSCSCGRCRSSSR